MHFRFFAISASLASIGVTATKHLQGRTARKAHGGWCEPWLLARVACAHCTVFRLPGPYIRYYFQEWPSLTSKLVLDNSSRGSGGETDEITLEVGQDCFSAEFSRREERHRPAVSAATETKVNVHALV
eukprot:6186996-Pleurochrysis_carterae.AAC.2